MNREENEIITIYQQEEELEQELEIEEFEEFEDLQQELDEILEEVGEIEQETLAKMELEQEQEQEILELERRNEAREEEKGEPSEEQIIEQEKEKEWLEYLVNWVKEEAKEDVALQLKEEVMEIAEDYDELDELTTKFQELYQKEQGERLSQSEKVELKALIKALQKHEPSHIVLFTNLRAMKRYTNHQKLKKRQLNRIFTHAFTKFSPNKQISRILKASKKQKTPEAEIFEKFKKLTHKNEFIKNLVNEFNKSGNWIKNLRPTLTFINFLKQKLERLNSQKTRSTIVKERVNLLSNYMSLISKVRTNNSLAKAIKNLFLKNKGKYNAFDIQNWLLITDASARNQLKKIFTEEEYQTYVRTQKHVSIKTIEEIAQKEGGKCHSKEIKNAKSKVDLECAEGHKWTTSYDSVVYQKTWCPECHIYTSESICRQFFERIFKIPFPKSYTPWLLNKKGNKMELDGYNEELEIAMEYQGIHHRKKAFGHTEEDVKKIQEDDAYKLQKCKEKGVILLQIPDEEIVPYDKMQKHIIKLYEKLSNTSLGKVPDYDWREFTIHENEHAKKFRKFVEEKGGTLLTPYFTAKKEVTILCQRGHEWTTTPNSIYKGNWCSECAGNKKGTSEEYRKIGEKFQCELINEYVNAKTPLRFKCHKGHVFTKDPFWLKKDYQKIEILCPECKMETYAQKFENFVRKKGGQILTPYKGRFKPIKIKCKKGHEWDNTPGATYQGRWCKTCAVENNPNKKRQEAAKQEFLKKVQALNYSLLSNYENNIKQVKIKCQSNHAFTITPKYFKRLANQKIVPCRKCRKKKI